MAVLVIGGHTRNIGKTSVVCALISAMPEARWTAIKITQFGHGVCSANGKPCDCETADHTLAVTEEHDPLSGTDSSRYLAAGAARSLWVRTRQGQLAEAMPRIRKELAATANVIIESNSILRFLKPDLYATVLDPQTPDFKASSLRYLDRAHLILLHSAAGTVPNWPGVAASIIQDIPAFAVTESNYCPPDAIAFIKQYLPELVSPVA